MSISPDIARFVVEHTVDQDARDCAVPAILDTLSVLAAGCKDPGPRKPASTFLPAQGGGTVLSPLSESRLRQEDAALLFGMAAHALDFDDVSMLAICHPSAPVMAGLLAAAVANGTTGRELCDALVIGTEVMIRLGQALGFRHFEMGFHATATLGAFGATAALARLGKADLETTRTALATAASLMSGLRLNFGSMVKPLHAGIAAANATRALAWANAGITASDGDLFDVQGLLEAFSGGTRIRWPDDVQLGHPPAIMMPGFGQKRFPCCYMLHKVIALGLEIAELGIGLGDIARMSVSMPIGGTRPLSHPIPKTGRQAMFSLPYALVAAIEDGAIGFGSFTDAAVQRSSLLERLTDVLVTERGPVLATAGEVGDAPVSIILEMTDGSTRQFVRDHAPGSAGDPLPAAELLDKWTDCLVYAQPGLSPSGARALYHSGGEALGSASTIAFFKDFLMTLRGEVRA